MYLVCSNFIIICDFNYYVSFINLVYVLLILIYWNLSENFHNKSYLHHLYIIYYYFLTLNFPTLDHWDILLYKTYPCVSGSPQFWTQTQTGQDQLLCKRQWYNPSSTTTMMLYLCWTGPQDWIPLLLSISYSVSL